MTIIPTEGLPLLAEFAPVFTRPTWARFVVLLFGTILTTGRRTVANVLRTVGARADGHASSYQRVLSQARWSGRQRACLLTRFLVRHFLPEGTLPVAGDDTVTEHRGKKVYGKARHRDAVRSSQSYTAHRYGHKWVVLCLLVKFPFATRHWALPVLVTLYYSPAANRLRGRPHRTPVDLLAGLLRVLLRWFPDRRVCCAADGSYATHALAQVAHRSQGRLTLVSRFYADAGLYEPPPAYAGKGRPRVKGAKLPRPCEVVATATRTRLTVGWYGGGERAVEVVTGTGQWYRSGHGLVPVAWVYVHDLTGTHRDEYFFSTDLAMTASQLIATYTRRWNIETTFQEVRAYLGLETTRGWTPQTVLRAAPGLFGLYRVVAALYAQLPARRKAKVEVLWVGKTDTTFADAITAVRRWLWTEWVFHTPSQRQAFRKLHRSLRQVLLSALAPAA